MNAKAKRLRRFLGSHKSLVGKLLRDELPSPDFRYRIVDTDILSGLAKYNLLEQLEEYTGEIIIPSRVRSELFRLKDNPAAVRFADSLPHWANEIKGDSALYSKYLTGHYDLARPQGCEILAIGEEIMSHKYQIEILTSDESVNRFLTKTLKHQNLCELVGLFTTYEIYKAVQRGDTSFVNDKFSDIAEAHRKFLELRERAKSLDKEEAVNEIEQEGLSHEH